MKKKIITQSRSKLMFCLTLIVLLVIPQLSLAKMTKAKGAAAIQGDDLATARDQALADALRKAVEMAVGAEMQTETVMQNYELLNERIYSKSEGYISSYKIIDEQRKEGIYWVTVSAQVEQGKLKDDLAALGLLIAKKKMPRIMVLIGETNVGFYSWNVYWTNISQSENAVISKLKERGFRVVDSSTVKRIADREATLKAFEGDDKAAALIAKKVGADLIIAGKASAEAGSKIAQSNMYSCNADITVRAIRTDTAEIIASGSEHAAKPHINRQSGNNEALKSAAETVTNSLIEDIITRWQTDVYSSNSATIFLISTDAQEAQAFKDFLLSSIRGVTEVVVRDVTGKSATLDLTVKGDAADLAHNLNKITFSGKKVIIVEQSLNKLSIRFE